MLSLKDFKIKIEDSVTTTSIIGGQNDDPCVQNTITSCSHDVGDCCDCSETVAVD